MRWTIPWTVLITYMALAVLLAGPASPWPWLGLLIAIYVNVYARGPAVVAAVDVAGQGPHFLRRRRSPTQQPVEA